MGHACFLRAALCVLLAGASPSLSAGGDAGFPVDEIAPGVWVHFGEHAGLDDAGRGDSANISFVVGDACIAVIDSGGSATTGARLVTAVRSVSALPVCYVVNTHVHFDHVLGNARFVGEAVRFVGHAALAEAMAANQTFFAESFATELSDGAKLMPVIGPDVLVEDTLEIDLGNRVLLLRAVEQAHSTTDLTVLDRKTNTLWTGDLLSRERLPVLDGSLKGWLSWMEVARAEDYAQVVPGHGPLDRAWPAGSAAQQRYLAALLEDTRAAIAAGLFIDEAASRVATGALEEWVLTAGVHQRNVSRAFRELEWE